MKRIFSMILIAALLSLCLGAAVLADEPETDPTAVEDVQPVEEPEAPAEEPAAEPEAEPVAEPEAAPEAEPEEAPVDEVPAEDPEAEAEPEADGGDPVTAGTCGSGAAWTLKAEDDKVTLTITGTGTIDDITAENTAAWENVTNIVIEDGITKIDRDAFYGLKNLKSVLVPASVTEICGSAFLECPNLTDMTVLNKDCVFETFDIDADGNETPDPDAEEGTEPNPAVATITPFDRVYTDPDSEDQAAHPLNDALTITAPKDSTAETFCGTYAQTFAELKSDEDPNTDDNKDPNNNNNNDNQNADNNNQNADNTQNKNTDTPAASASASPSPSASASPAVSPTASAAASDSPKTGDETPVALYIALTAVLTLAAACTGVILVKKHN